MKKTRLIVILTLAVAALLFAGCAAQTAQPQPIGADRAKELALKAAGVAEGDAAITAMDLDGGGQSYEIAFTANGEDYRFAVDAMSGEVSKQPAAAPAAEVSAPAPEAPAPAPEAPAPAAEAPAPAAEAPAQAAPQAEAGYITEAEARAAALEHAGVAESDATFIRCHLGYDDGRREYEVEFWSGSTEYDYDIDAATGEIISYDRDAEYYSPAPGNDAGSNSGNSGSGSGSDRIGSERAQGVALDHAGLSAAEVSGLRCVLDRDDGRTVYEIEFRQGRVEYDYEIDAYTGQIYKSEKDWDD